MKPVPVAKESGILMFDGDYTIKVVPSEDFLAYGWDHSVHEILERSGSPSFSLDKFLKNALEDTLHFPEEMRPVLQERITNLLKKRVDSKELVKAEFFAGMENNIGPVSLAVRAEAGNDALQGQPAVLFIFTSTDVKDRQQKFEIVEFNNPQYVLANFSHWRYKTPAQKKQALENLKKLPLNLQKTAVTMVPGLDKLMFEPEVLGF